MKRYQAIEDSSFDTEKAIIIGEFIVKVANEWKNVRMNDTHSGFLILDRRVCRRIIVLLNIHSARLL